MKAVVLLSGGLDSTVLLYKLKADRIECFPLAVNYGQRHNVELAAAEQIAEAAECPLVIVNADAALAPVFEQARSSQVGQNVDVPEGHYADPSMALTVVPNRNMLLISIAGAYAQAIGARQVAYAAHAGDHPIYPDCRPDFIDAARQALYLATDVELRALFAYQTKTDIVRLGAKLGVPFEATYSCYRGEEIHCGRCGTCYERREAFREAGVDDPTAYEPQPTMEASEAESGVEGN
jgi:7-cyano-7-deazaguanine synthase